MMMPSLDSSMSSRLYCVRLSLFSMPSMPVMSVVLVQNLILKSFSELAAHPVLHAYMASVGVITALNRFCFIRTF